MVWHLILALLIVALPPGTDEPPAKVFPDPWLPSVAPKPADPPDPTAIPTLRTDQTFIVKSDQPFVLRASPAGLVKVTPKPGPITVQGVFFDGGEDPEIRDYPDKFVAFVQAIKGASGSVELLFIPLGLKGDSDILATSIKVGTGPRPPPKPDPKPDDPPIPDPPKDPVKEQLQTITRKYTFPADQPAGIAKAFRQISADLDAGKITDTRDLVKKTTEAMKTEVGINELLASKWIDWRDEVFRYFLTLPLEQPKDNVKAFATVADVLEGR